MAAVLSRKDGCGFRRNTSKYLTVSIDHVPFVQGRIFGRSQESSRHAQLPLRRQSKKSDSIGALTSMSSRHLLVLTALTSLFLVGAAAAQAPTTDSIADLLLKDNVDA